jgi:cysteinyl-tRNA synthetase
MYTCGPTVYGRPHIGNYSSFLMADLLERWLEVSGFKVTLVKNITDVGHLVADLDEGEDKIEKQAREESGSVTHESVIAIARKYEAEYIEDEKALNILEPAHRPRASEYIDRMKEMIETLLEKNHAYVTDDGIYFDVLSFPQYGELSGNTLQNLNAGARVDVNDAKHHHADFALWKFCVGANEHHALRWASPKIPSHKSPAFASELRTGKQVTSNEGFPGWHIECSAMSRALLGDTIDIHTGGEDNIFPHHECEIAQSESVTGKNPFVKLWLHKRRIEISRNDTLRQAQGDIIGGDEISTIMSKSIGNVLTIPNIVERGYSPLDLRYYLLSVHYRTNLKFSWKGMDDAKKARTKIVEWMAQTSRNNAGILPCDDCDKNVCGENCQHDETFANLYADFRNAMNSDLNTPAALAAIFSMMSWYRNAKEICDDTLQDVRMAIVFICHTFGCFEEGEFVDIPDSIQALVDARAKARGNKDFTESDRLRDEIAKNGYTVRDLPEGQVVKKS